MKEPPNEELVYMSQDELEEYSKSVCDTAQLRKAVIIAESRLFTLKALNYAFKEN